MKAFLKNHGVVIVLFVILVLLVFLPILNDINHKILGNIYPNTQDGFQFIWNFWWAKKTCLGFCGDFWNTNYQFFPTGTSLLFQNFSYINLIIIMPLIYLGLTSVAAYNISLIFAVTLSLAGSYFLVFHLTKNKLAGFVSGLVYGLSPFIIGHILDGQLDLSSIQFFPFLFLCFIKSEESEKIIYPIASGVILFILTLTSPTFIIFTPLVLGTWVVYKLTTNFKDYKKLLQKTSIILSIFLIPFFIFFSRNFIEINSFNISGETRWNSEHFSSDLSGFIEPPETTFLGKRLNTNYEKYSGIYSDNSVYIGLSVAILSILGVIFSRKKWKELIYWGGLGFWAGIISLGPELHINGRVASQWMPFKLLEELPIFNMLRAPSRFSLFIFLSLAILTGYGTVSIINRLKNSHLKILASFIIILLVTFEYFPLYKKVSDLKIPRGYEKIKEDKENFAILEVPIFWMTGIEANKTSSPEYLYYQTFHEKKIASGYITRIKNETWKSLTSTPLLKFVANEQAKTVSTNQEAIKTLEKYSIINSEKILADDQFKYLILYKGQPTDLHNKIKNVLKDNLELYFEDEKIEIYIFRSPQD